MKKALICLCIASTLTLMACEKKPPADLPPAPIGSNGAGGQNGSSSALAPQSPDMSSTKMSSSAADGAGRNATPGSQADLVAKAGADRVFFATDQSDLDTDSRATLDKQAQWLAQYPNLKVTIEGHCDERGTREYNLALGDRRANAAKNYLVAAGVAVARINTISYGKERPEALGSDEAAWAKNRRAVTVTVQ